jgi:bacillopeptidase F (M6 metalloprotease family)
MSKSANRLYQESKSDLSFKEWLQIEQEEGRLKVRMSNADGESEVVKTTPNLTTKQAKVNMGKWNIVGLIAVGCLIYGLMQVSKKE